MKCFLVIPKTNQPRTFKEADLPYLLRIGEKIEIVDNDAEYKIYIIEDIVHHYHPDMLFTDLLTPMFSKIILAEFVVM